MCIITLFLKMENENIVVGSNTICGKNAEDNWRIIQQSEPEHTWFHLNAFPSAHVVIRSPNPSKEEIEHAANICKSHSKFKHVKNIKVVYTPICNLLRGENVGSVEFKSKKKCLYIKP